jgi:D-amino-acid oxidase
MASQDVVVIGAGVIGLTSAVCLAEAGLDVTCWTAAPPRETTSRVAGAMWGSSFAGPSEKVRAWAEVSLASLRELAGREGTGVRIASGTLASRRSAEAPPAQMFPGVEVRPRPAVPEGYLGAFEINVPLVDMPRYLDYLQQRLRGAAGAIEIHPVRSLDEVAGRAPVAVNCTGLGARELVPDPTLRPVRGQHVVVENPGLDEFFMEDPFAAEWTSWFPHAEHVILGGIAQPDAWDLAPDPEISARILERCVVVEPRLRDARVLEHQVGLRPGRDAVRVEEQSRGRLRCIHNYGHGASGVGLSWGCAREVEAMLAR